MPEQNKQNRYNSHHQVKYNLNILHDTATYTLIGESFARETFVNFKHFGQKIISRNFQILSFVKFVTVVF